HRDLKPANIVLAPDPQVREMPKIIDFGLAKGFARERRYTPLTRAGQLLGTPQFMAPEQIAGRPVDERTDVYSLGCVLYAMLSGGPPFAGSDDVQTLYRQVHEKPSPIPNVSPALAAVLDRALSKLPQDRFDSAADLARALIPTVEKRRQRAEDAER